MNRAILQACLPCLAVLAVLCAVAWVLARFLRARPQLARLRELHRNEGGGVQSLSFVLVLPFFMMVILFIVQVSQLMIAITVVHYAAYAAARSACVWIPARLPLGERENCISSYVVDPNAPDQIPPILNPNDPNYGPGQGGLTYIVAPGGSKYEKIHWAAVIACMPISPSRDLGLDLPGDSAMTAETLKAAYAACSPGTGSNTRIPKRLENKLAWSLQNTAVELRFYHKNEEPPLANYLLEDAPEEFSFNELGWQDQITVTVRHNLALLPGPGRLLAGYVLGYHGGSSGSSSGSSGGSSGSGGSSDSSGSATQGSSDGVSKYIGKEGKVYTYPLKATITMGNEGEKLVIPYEYQQ